MSFQFRKFDTPEKPTFKAICAEMHKCFGGAWSNIRDIVTSEPERQLVKAQLAELENTVREQFEQIKEVKDGE